MKVILSLIIIGLLVFPMVVAQGLVINTPVNGSDQDSRRVVFNLTANDDSFFYYLKGSLTSSRPWRKICSKIGKNCLKKLRAREGGNNFTIKAVNKSGNIDINKTTFYVDSKKPRIFRMFPRRNLITNGSLFYVKYSEDNLKNITLFYGIGTKSKINGTGCLSGKKQQCNFTKVNVSEFNGVKIWFWFKVSDGARSILSRKSRVKIDTEAPSLISFINIIDSERNRVKFIFEIKEDNLDRIFYKDISSCGPTFTPSGKLCTRLRNNRCVVTKTFCEGSHNLTITIRDKAGNSFTKNTSFVL